MNVQQHSSLWLIVVVVVVSATTAVADTLKINMDMIVVVNEHTPEEDQKVIKAFLSELISRFELGVALGRVGLVAYSNVSRDQLPPSYDSTRVQHALNNSMIIINSWNDGDAHVHVGLAGAATMLKRAGRPNALKVVLVLTSSPSVVGTGSEGYPDGRREAEKLREIGLLFMFCHQDRLRTSPLSSMAVEFLQKLAGNERIWQFHSPEQIDQLLRNFLFQLVSEVCSATTPIRLCRYTTANRTGCDGAWLYSRRYMTDCHQRLKPATTPPACTVEECELHCDTLWPWQAGPGCTCGTTRQRSGPNPEPDMLEYCPAEQQCRKCNETGTSSNNASLATTVSVRRKDALRKQQQQQQQRLRHVRSRPNKQGKKRKTTKAIADETDEEEPHADNEEEEEEYTDESWTTEEEDPDRHRQGNTNRPAASSQNQPSVTTTVIVVVAVAALVILGVVAGAVFYVSQTLNSTQSTRSTSQRRRVTPHNHLYRFPFQFRFFQFGRGGGGSSEGRNSQQKKVARRGRNAPKSRRRQKSTESINLRRQSDDDNNNNNNNNDENNNNNENNNDYQDLSPIENRNEDDRRSMPRQKEKRSRDDRRTKSRDRSRDRRR